MDFVYGEINQKAIKNTYTGGRTNTADVRIDDGDSIIYVDAHADTSYVDSHIATAINALDYSDSAVANQYVTAVNETNGIINVTRGGLNLTAEQIPTLPTTKIQGLDTALAGKQNLITNENKLSATLVSGLATVATSGAYSDLTGTPTVPTKTSDLTNDSGFITNQVSNLANYTKTDAMTALINAKQDLLVNQTNIKSINNQSLLGSGNITINTVPQWGNITGTLSDQTDLNTALAGKQATLVDWGTAQNIKTINNFSLLGSGNITIDLNLNQIQGYDATKTQILKNIRGSFVWVDEA